MIHRDLKLGNLFLNDEMEVKIGDFKIATKVEVDGERKKCAPVAIRCNTASLLFQTGLI